jgi:hypothetical protein
MPFDTNLRNTCIFVGILIIAFFPRSVHMYLFKSPPLTSNKPT